MTTPESPAPAPPPKRRSLHRRGFRATIELLREAFRAWSRNSDSSMAASVSYYAAFATAPTLVILVAALGPVVGRGPARAALVHQATRAMGSEGESAVTLLLDNASKPGSSALAGAIGSITLLISASGLFTELSRTLDIIWQQEARPSSVWNTIKTRALSFALVLVGGVFLLMTIVSSIVLRIAESMTESLGPAASWGIELAHLLLSFGGVTLLFGISFKVLPRAKMAWRDVFVGALMTAGLFSVGRSLIALYLTKSTITSSFGAAGSFAAYLAWLYYTAQIFFFGAELTHAYARRTNREAREDSPSAPNTTGAVSTVVSE